MGLIWAALHPLTTTQAMPVFMDLYDADPTANSEYRGKCGICHASEDSGIRTEFGKAFIDNGYRFSPELRKAFPDLFGKTGETGKAAAAATFDAKGFFETNCEMCHGNDGAGVAPGTPDFADAAWHRRNASDDPLAETIRAGRGIMPPFKDRLKSDEVKAMIAYVRKFSGQ